MSTVKRRHTSLVSCLAIVLAGLFTPSAAEGQFNPQGRKKQPTGARPAPRPGAKPAPAPRPSSPAPTETDTAGSREALIDRYTRAALSQPGSEFPVRRLAELARERDGNLQRLLADFEARASKEGAGRYAALIALGGLYEQAARFDEAARAYADAAQLEPRATVARLAQARLAERAGNPAEARRLYEAVLPQLTGSERELVLRDVVRLCLDTKDFAAAKRHHDALVRHARGSPYVRAELGRELLRRGEVERAVSELRSVAQASQGDNRALSPALRDLGSALITQGQTAEALDVLRRARAAAAGQPGLQREIDELLVTAHRREGRLAELVAELEKSARNDFDRLRILGRLYEETGEVDKALAVYRRALTLKKSDVDVRLKVVHLLELQGELDQAIAQYEELVQANPGDAPLAFRLADTLLQRGERARALGHLERLERSARGDEETLVALIDFYERVGEMARASKVLARLSTSTLRDPRHLVELGSRYWRDGKRDEARRTWQRILTAQSDRARALVTLGEVYLDHDLGSEALTALREAVRLRPQDARIKRSLAIALERVGAARPQRERNALWEEARSVWEELLAEAQRNRGEQALAQAREARQHIVKSWHRTGQLRARLSPLAARLRAEPPDVDAGRLLAEAELYLRKYADAEKTLRLVVRHAPGDVPSLLALERSLIAQDKREEAIEVLAKLIAADPQKARDYYQRSARYAAELYQDERAIELAVRAIELSPDDAEGHMRLGEMYRRRGDVENATRSYRQAIVKNDRLYPAYFELAELLVGQGREEEADRFLRRVVRLAPDDELVSRAARASLQIGLSRGSLEELESDLIGLALGHPGRQLYRRLLVEVYSTQAFPLVHRSTSGDARQREEAARRLARLGERAVKPLLDALGDEHPEQHRTALELLAHVKARGAAPALLAYAASDAPLELRERAVIAAGASGDERSLPKLEALVFEGGQAKVDAVAIAAAWAIARLDGQGAVRARQRLIATNVPELRTLGILGSVRSALATGPRARARALADLERALRATNAGPWPRAAAAFGSGVLDRPGSAPSAQGLTRLLDSAEPLLRAHALAALASLGHSGVEPILAEALTASDALVRSTALAAAGAYVTSEKAPVPDPLGTIPEGRLNIPALLEGLLPRDADASARARALIRLREPLEEASLLTIRSSGERAITVAQMLTARAGKPAFGPLTERLEEVDPTLRDEAERAARSITERVAPAFSSLLTHDSAEVRSASVTVLGLLPNVDDARATVLGALRDGAPSVQNAALSALGRSPHPAARAALIEVLNSSPDWRLRRGAAQALGRKAGEPEVASALRQARSQDALEVVREAADRALRSAESKGGTALDRPEAGALQ